MDWKQLDDEVVGAVGDPGRLVLDEAEGLVAQLRPQPGGLKQRPHHIRTGGPVWRKSSRISNSGWSMTDVNFTKAVT